MLFGRQAAFGRLCHVWRRLRQIKAGCTLEPIPAESCRLFQKLLVQHEGSFRRTDSAMVRTAVWAAGLVLQTAISHTNRCESMRTHDGWCQSGDCGVLRKIDGSFLAKTVCGGQQRQISIATDLKNRLPPGKETHLRADGSSTAMRVKLGRPVAITSGYRSPALNRAERAYPIADCQAGADRRLHRRVRFHHLQSAH